MDTRAKKNVMIELIDRMVEGNYGDYAIGISDTEDRYFTMNKRVEFCRLTYRSATIVKDAWAHFGKVGMMQLPQIGKRAKYLYMCRVDCDTMPKEFLKNEKIKKIIP